MRFTCYSIKSWPIICKLFWAEKKKFREKNLNFCREKNIFAGQKKLFRMRRNNCPNFHKYRGSALVGSEHDMRPPFKIVAQQLDDGIESEILSIREDALVEWWRRHKG